MNTDKKVYITPKITLFEFKMDDGSFKASGTANLGNFEDGGVIG